MLERRLTDAEQREILKEAQDASQLGRELSKRLLAFGADNRSTEADDLNSLVGAWSICCGAASARRSRSSQGSRGAADDHGRPGQVESALLNLAVNAGTRCRTADGSPSNALAELDEDFADVYAEVAPGRYVTLSVMTPAPAWAGGPSARLRAVLHDEGAGAGSGLGLSMVYGFAKQSAVMFSSTARLAWHDGTPLSAGAGGCGRCDGSACRSAARAASGETVSSSR